MIRYVTGNATDPSGSGKRLVIHVVNDCGAWGAGFVLAISKRWSEPEREYRLMRHELGTVQFVDVGDGVTVANMCAQHGFPSRDRRVALDYDALDRCLSRVWEYCVKHEATIHAPRFGAGIAGGSWERIEGMIEKTLCSAGVPVTIYDLPGAK